MILAELLNQLGPGVTDLDFAIPLGEPTPLGRRDFDWQIESDGANTRLCAECAGLQVCWSFEAWKGGIWVRLHLSSPSSVDCPQLTSLIVRYAPPTDTAPPLDQWWVPGAGKTVHAVGLRRVAELDSDTRTNKLIRGCFADAAYPGLFLGTRIPQSHEHDYTVEQDGGALVFAATTVFGQGAAVGTHFSSECTWLCASLAALAAQEAYAQHLPQHPVAPGLIPTGWNSWDYFAGTVSQADVLEQAAYLRHDPDLASRLQSIVVDMGWEREPGDWRPNDRFPDGLTGLATAIAAYGFVPGIWTAPTLVMATAPVARARPGMLLQDEAGQPILSEHLAGAHVLDPTHPEGEAFLRELYAGLFAAGFRVFKVDYAYEFSARHRYFDRRAGCYDVWRRLFGLIRESVGASHIIGCGLPAEAGPGLVDSNRIGVDVHNHWSHVEWIADFLQVSYWQHGRIAVNDPDFLVVRGRETSLEAETNPRNPPAADPGPAGRWRRGPVFSHDEAQTWASLVMAAGGSLFLGDRIDRLNAAGQAMIRKTLDPIGVAARPLDWCQARRASLWLQTLKTGWRLTVINWSDVRERRVLDLEALGCGRPERVYDVWRERWVTVRAGQLEVDLAAHASIVLSGEVP